MANQPCAGKFSKHDTDTCCTRQKYSTEQPPKLQSSQRHYNVPLAFHPQYNHQSYYPYYHYPEYHQTYYNPHNYHHPDQYTTRGYYTPENSCKRSFPSITPQQPIWSQPAALTPSANVAARSAHLPVNLTESFKSFMPQVNNPTNYYPSSDQSNLQHQQLAQVHSMYRSATPPVPPLGYSDTTGHHPVGYLTQPGILAVVDSNLEVAYDGTVYNQPEVVHHIPLIHCKKHYRVKRQGQGCCGRLNKFGLCDQPRGIFGFINRGGCCDRKMVIQLYPTPRSKKILLPGCC